MYHQTHIYGYIIWLAFFNCLIMETNAAALKNCQGTSKHDDPPTITSEIINAARHHMGWWKSCHIHVQKIFKNQTDIINSSYHATLKGRDITFSTEDPSNSFEQYWKQYLSPKTLMKAWK